MGVGGGGRSPDLKLRLIRRRYADIHISITIFSCSA